jgi:hypothetical protein
MNVADMQALLMAGKQFAEAAEISSTARGKLDRLCEALEPFRTMEVSDFSELLRQAEEYRQTGILPVSGKATKGSPKSKPATEIPSPQGERLLQQLRDLYAVVHEESVGFGAIDEMCAAIGKLNAAEVKYIAEQFGLRMSSKMTKPKSLEEIKRKLTEQKGSAQQIRPIANS